MCAVADTQDDRLLTEMSLSDEMAREAAEVFTTEQEAFALLDDAADGKSRLGNRLRALDKRSGVFKCKESKIAFKVAIVTSKVLWCRCHNENAAICPTALAGTTITPYSVEVEKVTVEPYPKLRSARDLHGSA